MTPDLDDLAIIIEFNKKNKNRIVRQKKYIKINVDNIQFKLTKCLKNIPHLLGYTFVHQRIWFTHKMSLDSLEMIYKSIVHYMTPNSFPYNPKTGRFCSRRTF